MADTRERSAVDPNTTSSNRVLRYFSTADARDLRTGDTSHIELTLHAAEIDTTKPATSADVRNALLVSLYEYSAANDLAAGSLLIIRSIDRLLREDNLDEVDCIMRDVNCAVLAPELGLAFLMITAVAKSRLKPHVRTNFVRCVRSRFMETRPKSYVDELLANYE
jgi:hypothetical protein